MPIINDRYYSNPAYGMAIERDRLAENLRDDRGAYGQQGQPQFAQLIDDLTQPRSATEPPSPPTPEPPAVITAGTPQNDLAQAQDAARTDDAYKPKLKSNGELDKSFCNTATHDIVQSAGGSTDGLTYPNGTTAVANDAGRYLPNSKDWQEVSPQDAQNLANQGTAVVGVQRNPGGHGHMVTVRPEVMPGLAQSLGQAPIVNSIGEKREIVPAAQAFPDQSQPVRYYAPNKQ